MSGSRLLLDTNVALYLLRGDRSAADAINEQSVYISFITRMELLSKPGITAAELKRVEAFVNEWPMVELDRSIMDQAMSYPANAQAEDTGRPDCGYCALSGCSLAHRGSGLRAFVGRTALADVRSLMPRKGLRHDRIMEQVLAMPGIEEKWESEEVERKALGLLETA